MFNVSTHIEVVARLEEVVELDDVGVARRNLLEDVDLIADLFLCQFHAGMYDENTHHVFAALRWSVERSDED